MVVGELWGVNEYTRIYYMEIKKGKAATCSQVTHMNIDFTGETLESNLHPWNPTDK